MKHLAKKATLTILLLSQISYGAISAGAKSKIGELAESARKEALTKVTDLREASRNTVIDVNRINRALQDLGISNDQARIISGEIQIAGGKLDERSTKMVQELSVVAKLQKELSSLKLDSSEAGAYVQMLHEMGNTVVNANKVSATIVRNSSGEVVLNASEVSKIQSALEKLATMSDSIAKMEKSEKEKYTQLMQEFNAQSKNGQHPAEALVQAIMKVKGINRVEALKLAEQLKECV